MERDDSVEFITNCILLPSSKLDDFNFCFVTLSDNVKIMVLHMVIVRFSSNVCTVLYLSLSGYAWESCLFMLLICCPRRNRTSYLTNETMDLEKIILNLKLEVLELSSYDLTS